MKQLLLPTCATFNAVNKTITFSTVIPQNIGSILHIANITRGVLYFQPQAGTEYSGTFTSPVLTLNCSTSGHGNGDNLLIFYDDNLAPASEESLLVLRRILKTLESNSVVDNKLRQKVIIEGVGNSNNPTSTEVAGTLPVNVAGSEALITQALAGAQATPASIVTTPISEGPLNQLWRVADASRLGFANGIRKNLVWS